MKSLIVILIFIHAIFLFPFLKPGIPLSHDADAHLARIGSYYKAFQDGQFPPRWAGNLNYGYGSPLFIFYYPLPGTIASVLHALGISLENSFKLIMALAFVLAPIAFYAWSSQIAGRKVAFVGSLLYGFAPYHFLDLYVRGDIAEILSFVFVPLVFLYIEKLKKNIYLKYIIIGGICYALLILSHNAVSLMFSPVFLTYNFVQAKRKGFVSCVILLLVGLLLSSFFWLPALVEGKFVQAAFFIGDMYELHFPTFQKLIYSSWGFGPDVYKSGGLSPQIGPLHIFLVFISGLLVLKKTKDYKIVFYWFILFIFVVFLTLSLSDFIWQQISLLKLFQFPWRFTALSSFIAAVLGMYALKNLSNKKILIVVAVLLIITSFPLVKTKEISAKGDRFYYSYKGSTDYHGAATTVWSAGDKGAYTKKLVEIISGDAKLKNLMKKSNLHKFTVLADSNSRILDNTIYFPGWQVFVDGKKIPIEFQDINYRGLITFFVPEGIHDIEVRFAESPIRLFSDIVSLLTLVLILVAFLFHRSLNRLLVKL